MKKILLTILVVIMSCIPAFATDNNFADKKLYGVGLFLAQDNTTRVIGVVPGSAADVNGIKAGDLLYSIEYMYIPDNYKSAMNSTIGDYNSIMTVTKYPSYKVVLLRRKTEVSVEEKNVGGQAVTTYKYMPNTKNEWGIGVQLGIKDGYPVIMGILKASPAEKAGLQNYESKTIVAIDGERTYKLPLDEVKKRLSGPANSKVNIQLQGGGSITIKRTF